MIKQINQTVVTLIVFAIAAACSLSIAQDTGRGGFTGNIPAGNIIDSGEVGRDLIRTATKAEAQAMLGVVPGVADGVAPLGTDGLVPPSFLPASNLTRLGVWNAATNTPSIVSGAGTANTYYEVGTAGTTAIDGLSEWKVGDWIAFNGTAWERISYSDVLASIGEDAVARVDALRGELLGSDLETNRFGTGITGFVRTTGVIETTSGWFRSGSIAIGASSTVKHGGTVTTSSAVAPLAFFDGGGVYLGSVGWDAITPSQTITVGDYFPTAKTVIASQRQSDGVPAFIVKNPINADAIDGLSETIATTNQLAAALINTTTETTDYFQEPGVTNGFYNQSGGTSTSGSWNKTAPIEVNVGDTFTFTGVGHPSNVAVVAEFDSNGTFLRTNYAASSSTDVTITITQADVDTIVVSAAKGTETIVTPKFIKTVTTTTIGTQPAEPEEETGPLVFAPPAIYALKDEPLYLYANNTVLGKHSLAWNHTATDQQLYERTFDTAGTYPIKLQRIEPDGTRSELWSSNIIVSDTPVNPSAARNIICLGDSLTEGTSKAQVQGAYPNELSRRLNGTGTALLSGDQSPASLTLTNFMFRGSLGDQPVKHEGRGGWTAIRYLTDTSSSFWNPNTSEFDLDYYITDQGFDTGTGAINSTGSNLTIIILLGWNDVYNDPSSQSATELGQLIDKIKEGRSAVDIILVGLPPAPEINFKSFSGERFVSKDEVFKTAIYEFGTAYRDLAETKTNTEFLQVSHVFNAEIGYATTSKNVSLRSAQTLTASLDQVHPDETGYSMLADAVFYKLINKYAQ